MYTHWLHTLLVLTWAAAKSCRSVHTVESFLFQQDQILIPYTNRPQQVHTGLPSHRRLSDTTTATGKRSRSTFVVPITTLFSSKNNNNNNDDYNSNNNDNNSFFQDIFQSAFANDRELLSQSNKRVGMLDEATNGDDNDAFVVLKSSATKLPELTPTQQAWRQTMLSSSSSSSTQQVQSLDIIDSTITIDLYLSGVPNKDPSNDLYASKTNISLRDRSVGQVLPNTPTISNLHVSFLSDNKCTVSTKIARQKDDNIDDAAPDEEYDSTVVSSDSDSFVNTNVVGDWKISDDGKQIRFRINVYGFQRTIQTKGTIQKIYWSNEKESITETSTIYSIPEGWIYLETELLKRSNGSVQWMNSGMNTIMNSKKLLSSSVSTSKASSNGIIKIEQTTGFLGLASKMVPCGKFIVTVS